MTRKNAIKVDFCIVRRDGFEGDVLMEFPKGIKPAAPCVATSGVERVTAKLYYRGEETLDMKPVNITARAKIGGKPVRVPVIPCDEYEQAFAWKHLLPAKTFLATAPGGGAKKR